MINNVPLASLNLNMQNSIRDNALIAYDATTDTLFDSGLFAPLDGELEAAAGTVSVGLQDMSSAGNEVVWLNNNNDICYAPPWHVVDEAGPGGSVDRFYGSIVDVIRESDNSTIVEDPSFVVNDGTPRLVTRMTFEFPEAQPKMVFEVLEAGESMWRFVTDVSAGLQEIRLDIPVTFPPGQNVFKIYRLDGQPARLKGNPTTQKPYYKVRYREVTEKALITKDVVESLIIPVFYDGPAEAITDATWGSIGVNNDTYVIHVHLTTGGVVIGTPVVSVLPPIPMHNDVDLTVYNASTDTITMNARVGESFEANATGSIIQPKTYKRFIKKAGVWVVLSESQYDASIGTQLTTLSGTVGTLSTNVTNLTTRVVALEEDTKPFYHEQPLDMGGVQETVWGAIAHREYILNILDVPIQNPPEITTPSVNFSPVSEGVEYLVINRGTNAIIQVAPRSGETMGGYPAPVPVPPRHVARFIKDSVNWITVYVIPIAS